MASGGFLDAAYQILKESGKPMHGLDIVRIGRERGMYTSQAKDDWALVRSITSNVKRGGNLRGFTVLGQGYYGLIEWDHSQASETSNAQSLLDNIPTISKQPVTFRIANSQFTFSADETIEQARQSIHTRLPAEAFDYQSWVIEIDGQRMSVKWLLEILTGIPRREFITHQARSIFTRLGLNVYQINTPTVEQPSLKLSKGVTDREHFFTEIAEIILARLPGDIDRPEINFTKRNYVQFKFSECSGCHYEVAIRRTCYEIGLHFESSRELSLQRMEEFLPEVDNLSTQLGFRVQAEAWGPNWARVYLELPLTDQRFAQGEHFASYVVHFIQLTFAKLRDVCASISGQKSRPGNLPEHSTKDIHAILDQEIAVIQNFVHGRASRPSDEKLCDWVHFCYSFQMYVEGHRIFQVIDPAQINPWYYERTKRLAKICELKMTGQA